MQLTYNNFGLSGQIYSDYDYFLCGRKCKKRRAEKRKIRNEKKRLKNDERRADTERVRSETKLMQQGFEPSPPPQPKPTVQSKQTVQPPPISQVMRDRGIVPPFLRNPPPQTAPTPTVVSQPAIQKAGFGNTPILIIGGLIVLGGIVFVLSKRNGSIQPAIAAAK